MNQIPRFIALTLIVSWLSSSVAFQFPAQAQQATTAAHTALRSAVAANNETALQRVETDYANSEEAALAKLLRGYLRLQAKDYANAIPLLSDPAVASKTELGDYALYHRAQALQDSGNAPQAQATFRQLAQKYPTSLLARTAALQAAGGAFLKADYATTLAVLNETQALAPTFANDGTALKLKADAFEKLGRTGEAINALRQIFFNAPHSVEAGQVTARLTALGGSTAPTNAEQLRQRADKLFATGLYVLAGQAYEQLARQFPAASTDEVWFKAGQSYYKGNSFAASLAALANVRSRNQQTTTEAIYFTGASHLALRNEAGVQAAITQLRTVAPNHARIGDLLYGLGRSAEKRNLEAQAAGYYEQVGRQFPASMNADEAHFWLAWRAHQAKDLVNAARLLTEHLALYGNQTENRGKAAFWAALNSERAGKRAEALTLYRALLKRYGAGWYGVNAERRITILTGAGVKPLTPAPDSVMAKAVAGLQNIRQEKESLKAEDEERLVKAEQLALIALQQSALNELEAAREGAPNSPLVNLRIAQIHRSRNENVNAINVLKRAYPDYGQTLPEEMTREEWDIFYPLAYWSAIKEQAKLRRLDPYYVAGLIRQETVFNATARSHANAYGLMQLLPSTGQSVAKRYSLGGGKLTTADLFNPLFNIQLGTGYLEQMVGEFGRLEYVAAAYNGGPGRVSRWLREFPALEIEDWVESIPISETRLYVQGVYRNMRQYQRLYDEQGRFKSNVPTVR
ncbi:MAG: transglycosylase SLT domain-containing protein [Acidobacteria bacterium]|nr:transglycosylase SLT domain-containing protein [Acidobacteriota bacterium]